MLASITKDILINLKQLVRCKLLSSYIKGKYDIREFKLNEYEKNSNMLFILATGTTINELGRKHFEFIKRHDSFAINFFLYHEFMPDIYLFEHIRDLDLSKEWQRLIPKYYKEENPKYILTSTYSLRKLEEERFKEAKKAISNHLAEKLRYYKIQFARHYSGKTILWSRMINRVFAREYLLHNRGSVSVAIDFGRKRGFKKIVFCGVDMDSRGHFYDQDKRDGEMHKTAKRMFGLTTLKDYVVFCNSYFKDMEFYVSSNGSRLCEVLPVFDWKSEKSE